MMCPYTERISAYYDGELAAGEAESIERHIEQCSQCAVELERLRKLSQLMRRIEIPNEFETITRLHRRLDSTRRHQSIQRFAEICTGLAASIMIVCGTILMNERASAATTESMPVWETVSTTPPSDEWAGNTSEKYVAQWIMQDLSRNNGNE
ncbi:MAG: zf-HC2 domain-containing protein [bacterium]